MAIATPAQAEAGLNEPETWALRALRAAAGFSATLDETATFRTHVAAVVSVASDYRAAVINGASGPGERVAAAARAEMDLPRERTDRAGTTLLVDGFVNTGIQLDLAMRRAVEAGATDVVCLALVAQVAVVQRWRTAGHELIALKTVNL